MHSGQSLRGSHMELGIVVIGALVVFGLPVLAIVLACIHPEI